jgi:hypothetical protein
MNEERATLATFFGITPADAETSGTSEGPGEAAPIEESFEKSLGDKLALVSTGAMLTAISVLMDIPLRDILVKAWNEGELFKKYTDPKNFDPDKEVRVVLKTHEVKSTHAPRIDVELNDRIIYSFDFELKVTLSLEGVVLNLRGGRVVDVGSGAIKGNASMTCQGLTLFDLETELMELPGKLSFAEPDAGEQ